MHPSSDDIETYYEFPVFLSFLVKNGRAVVYPVYQGTFERQDPRFLAIFRGAENHAYTEFVIQLVKDFSRTVDYLETRQDIDVERIAYYGMSWGGILGTIIPAVEDRLQTSILLPAMYLGRGRPEVHQANYISRITLPTLLFAGEYDTNNPIEQVIRPLFNMLGTPEEHKTMIIYPTDHIPPMNEVIRETLAWLDIYLGPVM